MCTVHGLALCFVVDIIDDSIALSYTINVVRLSLRLIRGLGFEIWIQ